MTIITQDDVTTIAGVDDNTSWTFFTQEIRESADGTGVVTTKKERKFPVAGVLTVQLDPGPAAVIAPNGKTYPFTVPSTDSPLWPLIQAAVTIPPSTTHQQLLDAVAAWLASHTNVWASIPDKPAPLAAGANVANGYAGLDGTGKLGTAQLPISAMEYKGNWNVSTNSPTLADGTGSAGDVYKVTVAGSRNLGSGSIVFDVGDYAIYNGTTWEKSDTTDAVASVAGRTGIVTLAKTDVGMGNADNTSDVNKPVSTAQQAALDGKQPLDTELTALGGLASAADKVPYFTGSGTAATADFTTAGRALVDDADAAAQRVTLDTPQALTTTAVKTSAYTAAVSDLIPADATSAAFTVTLPSAPADKSRVVVKKIDSSTNAVTVAAAGSDVFNKAAGSTTLALSLQFQAVQLQYKASGAIWYVVSTDVPLGALDTRYAAITNIPDVAGISGSALIKNTTRDWYGNSFNIGNVGDSFGWPGDPTTAPVTTITSGVTFPLTNATIPVADCAQLNPLGGSFLLGGKRVAYLGRSAASGAGNATGCFSNSTATGTVASGTAPTATATGFFGLTIYQRFGYDGRPNPGATQGFGVVTAYQSPTVDDSAESGSFVVTMADSGSPQIQNNIVTGGEMTAQLLGNWHLPNSYAGGLFGGGCRTYVSSTDHAQNVVGLKISPTIVAGGFTDNYDAIWQSSSGLQVFGTLNGAATFPLATVPVTGTFPPATTTYPVTVKVGCNSQGVGGTSITYTGQSGGNLTGCTGGVGTWASGSNVANTAYGANLKDPVLSSSGFLAGVSGWSGSFSLGIKGINDSANSMFSLTGPTNAEIAGGLTQVRLNAGSGQTKQIIVVNDTSGTTRFSISAGGGVNMNGAPIALQAAGVPCVNLSSIGFIQPGISTSAWAGKTTALGAKQYSGTGVPGTALVGASGVYTAVGDLYWRTDGGVGTTLYRCDSITGSNPVTAVTWAAIL